MCKIHLIMIMLVSILLIKPAFADESMMSSRPCAEIAKACMKAGYSRMANNGKKFWFDCMKPVILGKSVSGVNVDAATVKSCREDKLNALKKEVTEFENGSQ